MATFSDVTVLLTLVISNVHSLPGTPIFSLKGGEATFRVLDHSDSRPITLLYKTTENGSIFLKNASDPTQPSDSEQSYRVSVFFKSWTLPYFVLRNLSLSDSGQYWTHICERGICHEEAFHNLTVCGEKMKVRREEVDGVIEWTIKDVNQSQGDVLQIYQDTHTTCGGSEIRIILDTRSSFEILSEDMRRKMEVFRNSSSVRISYMSSHEDQAIYHILLWKGDQCQLYSETVSAFRAYNLITFFQSLPMKADNLTLNCHSNISGPVHWFHGKTLVEIQSRETFNMTPEQEDTDMYVDKRDYSLVFPSATPEHNGHYCCYPEGHPQDIIGHYVVVYSELNSTYLTFSMGDTVVLRCSPDTDGFWVSKWFRQKGLEGEELVVDIRGPEMINIHEDLRGRVNVSLPNSSLIISALTPEDSGVYRCRGWIHFSDQDSDFLIQRIHLLYKDPYGVDSMFYRVYVSLMGFGLLVMMCAVMSVKWRFRGGGGQSPQRSLRSTAETPGHLSRKVEQRGEMDEDVSTDGHNV